jgi:hypothetical protein
MSKNNVILDLDNTIISCLTNNQKNSTIISSLTSKYSNYHKLIENNITKYIIFERNNLKSFLDFLFNNFNVSIWTAASRRYASFIIEKVFKDRNLDYILFDYHVDLSKKLYDNNLKHLDLLFNTFKLPKYNINNTIIIDNLKSISNDSLPYKSYCCAKFDIVSNINNYNQDNELQTIRSYLTSTFNISNIAIEVVNTPENPQPPPISQPPQPKHDILGWIKVESRSRPGEFSYENKYTKERIPDEPKYEASKIENKSKDLLEYE